MDTSYPIYSYSTVALARAYDRAVLSARATAWLLESLEMDIDPPHFTPGDDSLADWVAYRNSLLREQLSDLGRAVHTFIAKESKPWFCVDVDETGCLHTPDAVNAILQPYTETTAFHYIEEIDGRTKAKDFVQDHYVILFEGDGYIVPKTIPKSFVEIWWRRQWFGFPSLSNRFSHYYEMALVENPDYGWNCYGHER